MSNQVVVKSTPEFQAKNTTVHLSVMDYQSTPSWIRHGTGVKGSATLRLSANKVRKWIDISLEEAYVGDKGRYTSKKTMMSIDPECAKEVYEMLKTVFEA